MKFQQSTHLGISFTERFDTDITRAFVDSLKFQDLVVELDIRSEEGPYASLDWLIPTAIVLFITQSYFAGFLGEAGKDHYVLFKEKTKKFAQKMAEKDKEYSILYASAPPRKLSDDDAAKSFSICAELPSGITAKLIIKHGRGALEREREVDAFINLVHMLNTGDLLLDDIPGSKPVSEMRKIAYMIFDPEVGDVIFVDPVVEHKKKFGK